MMSEKKILVIDDSSTIRRLVDRELSSAGYRVLLAENAETGLAIARTEKPDLILLDHQLPGTTGFQVCGQLLGDPDMRTIPVVVSSTLRKKAYVEYTDCANVVDMLPKPYTGDLLKTTVSNALDTASLIVQSQSSGSAVPEVIDAHGDADLQGTFAAFGLRELIDFLNNGQKHGMLEVDFERSRLCIYLDNGRIQAVTASGINPGEVAEQLPPALGDLAPMIKFTLSGRQSSQLDGLVELLDNKVLDARLLRQLLRHQAAFLLGNSQPNKPKSFRFDARQSAPALFTQLPLDLSLLALLVDAELLSGPGESSPEALEYSRRTLRGQNLDRAGLSAQHMKLLSLLHHPMTVDELSAQSGCGADETRCVMRGFEQADLVAAQTRNQLLSLLVLCSEPQHTDAMNRFLESQPHAVQGKVVRDVLAVKLLLRRSKPDWLLIDLDQPNQFQLGQQLQNELRSQLAGVRWLGLTSNPELKSHDLQLNDVISWQNFAEELSNQLGLAPPDQTSNQKNPELIQCR
jgi:CheY-like chemotaxis protein